MSLVINNNLMAMNAARNLDHHYGDLATSTRRLSSGLRIDTAADDAAGLAIRELMRADIAAMNQGVRNANDGISAIQTADGALEVVDSKLIRMKELAEQAATGTYTADQRKIIDQEFQQMKREIDRISNATEFNQVKLLNGSLSERGSELFEEGESGHVAGSDMKIHFGPRNNFGEDFYYIEVGDTTAAGLGIDNTYLRYTSEEPVSQAKANIDEVIEQLQNQDLSSGDSIEKAESLKNLLQQAANHLEYAEEQLGVASGTDELTSNYSGAISGLRGLIEDDNISGAINTLATGYYDGEPESGLQTLSNSLEEALNSGHEGITLGDLDDEMANHIITERAQDALEVIDSAIEEKDKVRADLGAYQNRLENTISNLQIQAENLQAAESRISDADIAQEMTEFTRNQVLSQGATAMLAQANTLPQMAMQLMG